MQAIGTLLVGIAAIAALIFTWQSVSATHGQLQVTEQGQITDRYNAAIANLGSASVDVRLGGIYALQRIMQDSPRDQPTIVAVLCAFVRDHDKLPNRWSVPPIQPSTDIQAALTVVGTRNTANDGFTTVVDFSWTDLQGANLVGANFARAQLTDADFTLAHLTGAHLAGAELGGARLDYADLSGADLSGADLSGADGVYADLSHTDLVHAQFNATDLSNADLTDANLTDALLYADLTGANLTGTIGLRRP